MQYHPSGIEKKWQTYWAKNGVYKINNTSNRPKYYVLDMFPYPSGAGLHVGHPLGYIASDIIARYKRLKGYNVLHPMGYDAFGLPAEQYAIETGVHPAISTDKNIKTFRAQLQNIGFSYDWSREIKTCDPGFYKWTQWIFLQMYQHYYDTGVDKALPIKELINQFEKDGNTKVQAAHNADRTFTADQWQQMSHKQKDDILMCYRLMYRKKSFVNWCEALGTVLANDEVKDGVSERGGHPVIKKSMMQWSMRTTAYAQRLLDGIEKVEWPKSLKLMQQNWIGRSEGARIQFEVLDSPYRFEVFTTRPDTIFGVSFMVFAPEHELIDKITTADQLTEIERYKNYVSMRSDRDRLSDSKKVTGAFTGAYVTHPFTGESLPVWISEYVLLDYGCGAIMAVPSEDKRDQAFAHQFGLPILPIIDRTQYPNAQMEDKVGKMIHSDFIDGLEVLDAIESVLQKLESLGIGQREVNFKLRDANFSRQRYWGEPFPILYDKNGVSHPVDDQALPVILPEVDDFKPGKDGRSPLARLTSWAVLGGDWTRETDTMPGFAGSSWYYLKYMDPSNDNQIVNTDVLNYWQDVDLYIGGAEHAVGHLLYSRTWHKFLFDLGKVPTEEPFKKLINQGMIQGVIECIYLKKEKENGQAVFVSAELIKDERDYAKIPVHIDFVKNYGQDDSYLDVEGIHKFVHWKPDYKGAKFVGPHGSHIAGISSNMPIKIQTKSEVGKMSKRYFNVINPDDVVAKYGADAFRMYEMFLGPIEQSKPWDINKIDGVSKFIRKCWSLYFDEEGQINLSSEKAKPASLKILHQTIKLVEQDIQKLSLNTCVSHFMICVNELKKLKESSAEVLEPLLILIAPFAPHFTEELWHLAGHTTSIHLASFPVFDKTFIQESHINYPVCINGKKRAMLEVPNHIAKEELEEKALRLDTIKKWTDGKEIRKVIVVPNKMINVVI